MAARAYAREEGPRQGKPVIETLAGLAPLSRDLEIAQAPPPLPERRPPPPGRSAAAARREIFRSPSAFRENLPPKEATLSPAAAVHTRLGFLGPREAHSAAENVGRARLVIFGIRPAQSPMRRDVSRPRCRR